MSRITYEQAFSDHCYLWRTYGSAEDMTGAYVDQEDLAKMLASPTKATARDCLERQIAYWFSAGPDQAWHTPVNYEDPILLEIAERHGQELPS